MASSDSVLKVVPLLCLIACVSDLSPDPHKSPELGVADAGQASGDAARPKDASASVTTDARTSTPAKDASTAPSGATDASGGAPSEPEGEPEQPGGEQQQPSAGGCDLSGRWIMTERNLSSAYGAKQINLNWLYVELTQQGDDITFKKSLLCGGSTQGEPGGFPVMMDDSQAWPAYQEKTNYDGRTGSSKDNGGGCDVKFDEGVLIRGMTPEYKDMSVKLPAADEEATANSKGWEDWDADGKPGVTMNVSGSASGKVFTAFRSFATNAGSADANASTFELNNDWVQERAVLATDPSDPITRSLLASPAERAPDEAKNYVEVTRLAADQATGDDSAICDAIRKLAPTLNPKANKI